MSGRRGDIFQAPAEFQELSGLDLGEFSAEERAIILQVAARANQIEQVEHKKIKKIEKQIDQIASENSSRAKAVETKLKPKSDKEKVSFPNATHGPLIVNRQPRASSSSQINHGQSPKQSPKLQSKGQNCTLCNKSSDNGHNSLSKCSSCDKIVCQNCSIKSMYAKQGKVLCTVCSKRKELAARSNQWLRSHPLYRSQSVDSNPPKEKEKRSSGKTLYALSRHRRSLSEGGKTDNKKGRHPSLDECSTYSKNGGQQKRLSFATGNLKSMRKISEEDLKTTGKLNLAKKALGEPNMSISAALVRQLSSDKVVVEIESKMSTGKQKSPANTSPTKLEKKRSSLNDFFSDSSFMSTSFDEPVATFVSPPLVVSKSRRTSLNSESSESSVNKKIQYPAKETNIPDKNNIDHGKKTTSPKKTPRKEHEKCDLDSGKASKMLEKRSETFAASKDLKKFNSDSGGTILKTETPATIQKRGVTNESIQVSDEIMKNKGSKSPKKSPRKSTVEKSSKSAVKKIESSGVANVIFSESPKKYDEKLKNKIAQKTRANIQKEVSKSEKTKINFENNNRKEEQTSFAPEKLETIHKAGAPNMTLPNVKNDLVSPNTTIKPVESTKIEAQQPSQRRQKPKVENENNTVNEGRKNDKKFDGDRLKKSKISTESYFQKSDKDLIQNKTTAVYEKTSIKSNSSDQSENKSVFGRINDSDSGYSKAKCETSVQQRSQTTAHELSKSVGLNRADKSYPLAVDIKSDNDKSQFGITVQSHPTKLETDIYKESRNSNLPKSEKVTNFEDTFSNNNFSLNQETSKSRIFSDDCFDIFGDEGEGNFDNLVIPEMSLLEGIDDFKKELSQVCFKKIERFESDKLANPTMKLNEELSPAVDEQGNQNNGISFGFVKLSESTKRKIFEDDSPSSLLNSTLFSASIERDADSIEDSEEEFLLDATSNLPIFPQFKSDMYDSDEEFRTSQDLNFPPRPKPRKLANMFIRRTTSTDSFEDLLKSSDSPRATYNSKENPKFTRGRLPPNKKAITTQPHGTGTLNHEVKKRSSSLSPQGYNETFRRCSLPNVSDASALRTFSDPLDLKSARNEIAIPTFTQPRPLSSVSKPFDVKVEVPTETAKDETIINSFATCFSCRTPLCNKAPTTIPTKSSLIGNQVNTRWAPSKKPGSCSVDTSTQVTPEEDENRINDLSINDLKKLKSLIDALSEKTELDDLLETKHKRSFSTQSSFTTEEDFFSKKSTKKLTIFKEAQTATTSDFPIASDRILYASYWIPQQMGEVFINGDVKSVSCQTEESVQQTRGQFDLRNKYENQSYYNYIQPPPPQGVFGHPSMGYEFPQYHSYYDPHSMAMQRPHMQPHSSGIPFYGNIMYRGPPSQGTTFPPQSYEPPGSNYPQNPYYNQRDEVGDAVHMSHLKKECLWDDLEKPTLQNRINTNFEHDSKDTTQYQAAEVMSRDDTTTRQCASVPVAYEPCDIPKRIHSRDTSETRSRGRNEQSFAPANKSQSSSGYFFLGSDNNNATTRRREGDRYENDTTAYGTLPSNSGSNYYRDAEKFSESMRYKTLDYMSDSEYSSLSKRGFGRSVDFHNDRSKRALPTPPESTDYSWRYRSISRQSDHSPVRPRGRTENVEREASRLKQTMDDLDQEEKELDLRLKYLEIGRTKREAMLTEFTDVKDYVPNSRQHSEHRSTNSYSTDDVLLNFAASQQNRRPRNTTNNYRRNYDVVDDVQSGTTRGFPPLKHSSDEDDTHKYSKDSKYGGGYSHANYFTCDNTMPTDISYKSIKSESHHTPDDYDLERKKYGNTDPVKGYGFADDYAELVKSPQNHAKIFFVYQSSRESSLEDINLPMARRLKNNTLDRTWVPRRVDELLVNLSPDHRAVVSDSEVYDLDKESTDWFKKPWE